MCDSDNAQYLKRRIKFDSIDVHPIEKALVVFYRIEAMLLSSDGEPVTGEKRVSSFIEEAQKMIKVQSLNSSTDINGLAKEVIHQCKLIPSSRLNEVQQLLSYLQARPDSKPANMNDKFRPMTSSQMMRNDEMADIINQQMDEQASMGKLEAYIELLYEELEGKIRGTSLILQLAKRNENLQDLSRNEALIGALYRVLREDGRKHYALAVNIAFTFFYFTSYSSFHPILTRFKVGSLLMEIVRGEFVRFEQWESELNLGHFEQDGLHRKFQTALLQQTFLIRTCFYVLLHLSEDPGVEDKMRKKGIVSLLIRTLQRKHIHSSVNELNYLVLTFLQKLSIFGENKDEMAQLGVIEKAAILVDSPHRLVQDSAARVLYNLSFDPVLRLRIGRLGLLPSLIRMMLTDSQGGNIAWALVYQISLDDRGRILISRSECFSFVLEYLLRCKEIPLPSIPLALAVNLAHVPKLATELSQSKYFALFLDLAIANQDAVLIKLLRNAAGHAMSSQSSNPVVMDKLVDAILKSSGAYFNSEALGLLANLGEFSLSTGWETIFNNKSFLRWIDQHLQPGTSPFDVQLSAVLVLRSIAAAPEASLQLIESGLVSTLLNLLRMQQEDDEFVLQILHVFYRLLRHGEICFIIVNKFEDIPASFLDLMTDQNLEVRKVCERGLMLIAEADAKWEERIKNERFCWHNAQWLEAIAKTNLLSSPGTEDEQSIAGSVLDLCVRHADLLDRASNSASSFGSPESRIGSPVDSIDALDTQI
ncbi:Kinesin-associated protein 3 [Daphnia magna]|uniref:Kinesin-associated protein 3 n=1 Tax=Daphnia magna TaxID=35525 RepID=A0A162SE95_9CRUS|nr:Kinesin-associated protein 3 [Daphnia magna]